MLPRIEEERKKRGAGINVEKMRTGAAVTGSSVDNYRDKKKRQCLRTESTERHVVAIHSG